MTDQTRPANVQKAMDLMEFNRLLNEVMDLYAREQRTKDDFSKAFEKARKMPQTPEAAKKRHKANAERDRLRIHMNATRAERFKAEEALQEYHLSQRGSNKP